MGLTLCLLIISLFRYCLCFPHGSNNTDIQLQCPDYGKIEYAKVKTYKLDNTAAVVHVECEQGYELEGNQKFFRNFCKDGQWIDLPRPKCIPDLCTIPPNIDNGIITIEGEKDPNGFYKKGTLVTYTCNDGYRLTPSESKYRVCEKTIWTGAMGKCVLMGCESPKVIENGYSVLDKIDGVDQDIYVEQRVYYSCSTGYVLKGPPMQQCIDGSWTPRIPPVCTQEINGKLFLDQIIIPITIDF